MSELVHENGDDRRLNEASLEAQENFQRFDRLKFDLLTDDQLVLLLQQARTELMQRHPLLDREEDPKFKCPKCGEEDLLHVQVLSWAYCSPEGLDLTSDFDDRMIVDPDSDVYCPECCHQARATFFLKA